MAQTSSKPTIPMNGKFILPSLGPLGSLTAGTDIPPPPDSPIEEKPSAPTTTATTTAPASQKENQHPQGTALSQQKLSEHGPPGSPTSTRPGSVRRFLSLRSLNSSFTDSAPASPTTETPGSVGMSTVKQKRSWFRKRKPSTSDLATTKPAEEQKKKGPPPPTLPELGMGKGDQTSIGMGGDLGGKELFENIK
ncbi:MAG: hypothetical protein M1824_003933 [Vezdaea acicularis]|nr:MAG: hypothetical protein M1824_003933 [Vezdaea acicularis]